MAPVGERLATLEAEVKVIKATTSATSVDVKELLRSRDEERGAREAERIHRTLQDQRMSSRVKMAGIFLTTITIVLNVLFRVI